MYFIYNDNPKNIGPDVDPNEKHVQGMGNPIKSVAVLVELSESGIYTKNAIFSNKDAKNILEPKLAFKVNDHEFVVPAMGTKGNCCFWRVPDAKKYTLARFDFQ